MKIPAATGLARILKSEGVEWVSTFPVCSVNNALGAEGLDLIMMRDERYAVAVADAFSRVNGGRKIGVCTLMGALNPAGLQVAHGAMAQAFEDSSPVLCIADGLSAGDTAQIRYDCTSGMGAVTKWIGHIDQPGRVPAFMRRAFTYLRTGRPGPVLITVPRDFGEYDDKEDPYTPVKGWKSAPDAQDVRIAVQQLLNASAPLLYAGEGVFYANATEQLLRFAEVAEIPVLTTLKAKSVFPENHPLSVGVRGEPALHFLAGCDLIVAVGCSLSRGHFTHALPAAEGKSIIQCTVDAQDINRGCRVDHALIGDAKLTLEALTKELADQISGQPSRNADVKEEIASLRADVAARYEPVMESDETPINPYRVYGDLMKTIDRGNSFVSPDSGNTRDQTSTVYEAKIPRGFLGWGNVSTLGFSLAAAVGAKLAFPERQCVNITGDAGVGYMLGNFEALVRHRIGVTTIHINNGGFAGYGPGFWGAGHDPYTCAVSDHSVANMAAAAEAVGCYAEYVTEPGAIIPALKRAFGENETKRPAYLEFQCCQYPVFGAWAK